MQSSALGFLLAQKHFTNPLVAVPSAVSVVAMALGGSALAVYWRNIGLPANDKAGSRSGLCRSGPFSLLSYALLPSFPGGDDWASGGAICPVFAQPFAGDERILQIDGHKTRSIFSYRASATKIGCTTIFDSQDLDIWDKSWIRHTQEQASRLNRNQGRHIQE